LSSFIGRSKLPREEQLIYWSVYGVQHILETHFADETDLIDSCRTYLESLERFINLKDITSPHS
jgi:hypothetical protein